MKHATPRYMKLLREMGQKYWQWQNALPSAENAFPQPDPEYIDFLHGEYEIAEAELKEEEARIPESR